MTAILAPEIEATDGFTSVDTNEHLLLGLLGVENLPRNRSYFVAFLIAQRRKCRTPE